VDAFSNIRPRIVYFCSFGSINVEKGKKTAELRPIRKAKIEIVGERIHDLTYR
jgi:hypothetical protein